MPDAPPDLVSQFTDSVAAEDYPSALRIADEVLARGEPGLRLLIDTLIPSAQLEVGNRWERGEWTVAQEHQATDLMTTILDRATGTVGGDEPAGQGSVVVTCAEGEWHSLTTRTLSIGLELAGWQPVNVSPSLSASQLLAAIYDYGPDAVALSCSMPGNLVGAHRMVMTAHETGTPVVIGGTALGPEGHRAKRVGADEWAPSASGLGGALDRVTGGVGALAEPSALHDEYWYLLRRERALVDDLSLRLSTGEGAETTVAAGGVRVFRCLLAALLCDELAILAEQFRWHDRRAALGDSAPAAHIASALLEVLPDDASTARDFVRLAALEAGSDLV